MEARGSSELVRQEIDVAGVRRSYWVARAPRRRGETAPPLLIALHGSGMSGRDMARFTRLDKRGPAAGVTTVFPDGWRGRWHPVRAPAGEPDLDDALFLAELCGHVEGQGAARSWPVFLAGISQGARYAEHVARNGLLPVTGLFLVAGTALQFSRRQVPIPQLRASMVLIMGTSDPTAPYRGGPLTRSGLIGFTQRRRARRHGELPGENLVAGAEEVVGDWATGNGIIITGTTRVPSTSLPTTGSPTTGSPTTGSPTTGSWLTVTGNIVRPTIEELPLVSGDRPVTRTTWTRPGCHSATLYRVDGGGHGWPGGPQFLPKGVIGPIPKQLDATGLLLDMAERETAIALGYSGTEHGEIA